MLIRNVRYSIHLEVDNMEPWQKREFEQQRFIEKMADRVRDIAEKSGNYTAFIGEFSIALLRSIVCFAGGEPIRNNSKAEDLRDDLLPEFNNFQRAEGELTYLIGLLLQKLSVSIYSFTQRKYQSSCMADPEGVYGAAE